MIPPAFKRLACRLGLLALCCLPASGWAAASCSFNAQGQLLAPQRTAPSDPARAPWGGIGGTGIQAANRPAATAPGDGWGGVGGTGVTPAASAPLPAQASAQAHPGADGWGGIGGTGVQPQTDMPAHRADHNADTAQEGWGGIGGTGIQSTPLPHQVPQAGTILFAHGPVFARQGMLPARLLAQGDAVCEGDEIRTGSANGMLQIRMADQGAVMLYADSRLQINTFHLPAKMDGSERLAMTLLQGGMRAQTGDIGHVNKANYLIQTPSAEVHVRGTDHEVFYIPQPSGRFNGVNAGTYNHVIRGGTTLSNSAGSVRIDPNQSGFAPLAQGLPQPLTALPEVLRAMPMRGLDKPKAELATDPDSTVQNPADPMTPLPNRIVTNSLSLDLTADPVDSPDMSAYVGATLSGGHMAIGAIDGNTDEGWQVGVDSNTGLPIYAVLQDESLLFFVTYDTAQPVTWLSSDIDGATVYWGLYKGGAASDANGDWQYADLHAYAFSPGGSTPQDTIHNMSGTLTYNAGAGTAPISENGTAGGQLTGVTATVKFGADPQVLSYAINLIDGQNRHWDAQDTGAVSLSAFKNGNLQLAGHCNGCSGGVVAASGAAAGVLIGNNAGGMITSYQLNTNQKESVSGAAVLSTTPITIK